MGPIGPGNPLDAALRAIREYLRQNGDITRNGETYDTQMVRTEDGVARTFTDEQGNTAGIARNSEGTKCIGCKTTNLINNNWNA